MTNDLAFCTISHGEKYVNYSKNLIRQITSLGYPIFVYTTSPEQYSDIPHTLDTNDNTKLVKIIKNNNPYFSYHQKLEIAKIAIQRYNIMFYLDCDVELINLELSMEPFINCEPGLHIFSNLGSLENFFFNDDINVCQNSTNRNTKYGKEGLKFISSNGWKYKKIYHGPDEDYLEHFLEGRWLLKRDEGKEFIFFDIWQKIREFCEKKDIELGYLHTIGAGEGGAMSIAALNSGIKMNVVSPLISIVKHNFISNYQDKLNNLTPWNLPG